ncbi:glycosyltransferase [Cellulomonas citrea]|uniref:glycosyltransferase n=1 Tax=Cellulomonas citrea TaxID=1909423 RepID=UPI001357A62D|nr:glycosyltransferase [Cellulomonas citrea]
MAVRLGFLSTYPPTQCGIATFCQALAGQLAADGAQIGVVRLVDSPQVSPAPVVAEWVTSRPQDAARVAQVLDGFDVAVLQHEYGIFGGPDGQDVLEVVRRLRVPLLTVLHTVLTQPSANEHRVLAGVLDRSDVVVTMTRTARDRLLAGWAFDPARVVVIPHGAAEPTVVASAVKALVTPATWRASGRAVARATTGGTGLPGARATVLTWGLLSPGKGIEWALLALAELRDRIALPTYQVVGQTHPKVAEHEGEAYRDRLLAMTRDLGLADSVRFDGRYLSRSDLDEVVRRADVVLLPYDSVEQVTSGVLTEAVAAGKPVVSTSFPHATELLSGGAGLLVPQRDPGAIADALQTVLTSRGVAASMAATSRSLAAELLWPAVAARYLALAGTLTSARSIAGTPAGASASPRTGTLTGVDVQAVAL